MIHYSFIEDFYLFNFSFGISIHRIPLTRIDLNVNNDHVVRIDPAPQMPEVTALRTDIVSRTKRSFNPVFPHLFRNFDLLHNGMNQLFDNMPMINPFDMHIPIPDDLPNIIPKDFFNSNKGFGTFGLHNHHKNKPNDRNYFDDNFPFNFPFNSIPIEIPKTAVPDKKEDNEIPSGGDSLKGIYLQNYLNVSSMLVFCLYSYQYFFLTCRIFAGGIFREHFHRYATATIHNDV